MSWGALPCWVFDVMDEKDEAMILGAFEAEMMAGFVMSTPEHVVEMAKRNWEQGEDDC